jgi:acylaminoacyl-peptidase
LHSDLIFLAVISCQNDSIAHGQVARGLVDPARLFFQGGSHAGFLGAHLAGRHPETFRAFSLKNPCTNVAAQAAASDVADYGLEELALPHAHTHPAALGASGGEAAAAMQAMYAASPHAHVHAVRRPVLLCVGDSDRRAPPFQSRQYHLALRERGVPTRLLVYPGQGHALAQPAMEADAWLNTMLWFQHFMHDSADTAGPAGKL